MLLLCSIVVAAVLLHLFPTAVAMTVKAISRNARIRDGEGGDASLSQVAGI